MSTLRAELASWILRVRNGEEVLITDRGIPVARLVPVDSGPLIERLTREGVLGAPKSAVRPIASDLDRVTASGTVSQYVREQRR
jgi:prevent-host-death family protein